MVAKKATTRSSGGETSATKASAEKKTAAKKAPAKKSTAKKAPAKKSTSTKGAAKSTTSASAKKAGAADQAARLVVREDESPWTAAELKEIRAELEGEVARLTAGISENESDLSEFLKEPISGAGDDQADSGSKSFEREHEISLAASARAGLEQNEHALERLDDGTYGQCESCGKPIGKLRLQAYPRATLCLSCKSRQERR